MRWGRGKKKGRSRGAPRHDPVFEALRGGGNEGRPVAWLRGALASVDLGKDQTRVYGVCMRRWWLKARWKAARALLLTVTAAARVTVTEIQRTDGKDAESANSGSQAERSNQGESKKKTQNASTHGSSSEAGPCLLNRLGFGVGYSAFARLPLSHPASDCRSLSPSRSISLSH